MKQKKVKIRFSITMDFEVPEGWEDDMVNFFLNESSFCLGNLIEDLGRELDEEDPNLCNVCHRAEAHVVNPPTSR